MAAFSLLLPGGVRANPSPACIIFTHIHQAEGDLCAALPVAACEEIESVTQSTGTLAFDLIMKWGLGGLIDVYEANSNLEFTIQWPPEWQFVDAQVCGSGATSVASTDSSATFAIEDLHGAPAEDPLFGLARLVLLVTGEGSLQLSHQSGFEEWATWGGARAGLECGTCLKYDCDFDYDIRPVMDLRVLELVAAVSGLAAGAFHVDTDGFESPPYIGAYTFEQTQPWLSLETVSLGSPCCPAYDVTVLADGAALDPGLHEAWIEVHAPWCYECVKVLFTVPGLIPPAVEKATWGGLKSRFR